MDASRDGKICLRTEEASSQRTKVVVRASISFRRVSQAKLLERTQSCLRELPLALRAQVGICKAARRVLLLSLLLNWL